MAKWLFIATLAFGYAYVSNQDFEDAQLAHSSPVKATPRNIDHR
jgi:hypothetical protein